MKLNLAAGEHAWMFHSPPWWNVDLNSFPNIQQRMNLLSADWVEEIFFAEFEGPIDTIYIGHFLEHLTPMQALDLLQQCYTLLTVGGKIVVVSPDIQVAQAMHARKQLPDDMLEAIEPHGWAVGDNVGGLHAEGLTVSIVRAVLDAAGFNYALECTWNDLHEWDIPVINAAEWQLVVSAEKSSKYE